MDPATLPAGPKHSPNSLPTEFARHHPLLPVASWSLQLPVWLVLRLAAIRRRQQQQQRQQRRRPTTNSMRTKSTRQWSGFARAANFPLHFRPAPTQRSTTTTTNSPDLRAPSSWAATFLLLRILVSLPIASLPVQSFPKASVELWWREGRGRRQMRALHRHYRVTV